VSENEPRKTFYEILKVHTTSNAEAIRRAWRLAAWEHHPDLKRADTEAGRRADESHMQLINEAYQTLSDPEKRRRYDLEMGLLPARCSNCGAEGSLRLSSSGNVVAICTRCYREGARSTAL
jgi:hypothetical protein